ncbi:MAG TPA: bifunctional phosphoribosylaminoimidazolecarboxamide formyltransferase/IMP cyclohydrolase [Candidatus Kapabacteria bacterium]|nr:bifunctional phosphoribosylaminoimidazolecarboxamide formyltransferase/IMP cyclohydrolase [Candidatus Kapabacteria bacterium]
MDHPIKIKTAIISVSDKSGLKGLAEILIKHHVELYSTGGTERFLREHGFDVKSITDLTNFPEMMDGRVKTLHPAVHGGLLYRRDDPIHVVQATEHKIKPIDLLVVNLYPFEATVANPNSTHEEIVENIDIGGPAMLRSAAKNYDSVTLLTSPAQYPTFIEEFSANDGKTGNQLRLKLAAEAFEHVVRYDRAIADYFIGYTGARLRYGENPHQKAIVSGSELRGLYDQLWGKELSFNNYIDASASLELIGEFTDEKKAVVGIIKHTNPCGIAEGSDVLDAFERAFKTDTESPFGGIIVMNRACTKVLAERINEFFSEVILAPSFDDDALDILKKKKDRRLLKFNADLLTATLAREQQSRSIVGGTLTQDRDHSLVAASELVSVTKRAVTPEELETLIFAWKVCKHVKSNAIVYARTDGGFAHTVGIGGGQTSRVASSRIAAANAKRFGHDLKGSFVASDAFFPFADGLVEAADAGAVAVIEPGGSVRDAEVIAAANERNVALVLTGMRHFKH